MNARVVYLISLTLFAQLLGCGNSEQSDQSSDGSNKVAVLDLLKQVDKTKKPLYFRSGDGKGSTDGRVLDIELHTDARVFLVDKSVADIPFVGGAYLTDDPYVIRVGFDIVPDYIDSDSKVYLSFEKRGSQLVVVPADRFDFDSQGKFDTKKIWPFRQIEK